MSIGHLPNEFGLDELRELRCWNVREFERLVALDAVRELFCGFVLGRRVDFVLLLHGG